ncbi:MAG: hypothetical protein ACTSRG_09165 [Candidatus Helarchaeota archaeon]
MEKNHIKKSNLEKGIDIRRKILKLLPNNIYQLAIDLNRNPSTIQHHLNILSKQAKVSYFKKEENGRTQKIYTPFELNKKKNVVKVSKELFIPNQNIFAYTLDSNTLGICNYENKEWKEISLTHDILKFNVNESHIDIEIPEKILNFYKVYFNAITPTYNEKKDCILLSF